MCLKIAMFSALFSTLQHSSALFSTMSLSDMTVIFLKADIKLPVQVILNRSMTPCTAIMNLMASQARLAITGGTPIC